MERFDVAVLGAGLFGIYAALHFSRRGKRVILIEREGRPWTKASFVNQARVHSGYHYPRSMKTARMAHDHRERFIREHTFAVNSRFAQYYGIDRFGSLTSPEQFTRFCQKIDIPLRQVVRTDLFDHWRIEALFETEEFSFDPLLLRAHYLAQLEASSVETLYGWSTSAAALDGKEWELELSTASGETRRLRAGGVVGATYANINAINRIFQADEIPVTHELSEVVLLHCPQLAQAGITIMDGPYCSMMPFGLSGLHSLTSVLYTHRAFSSESDPVFQCQAERSDCTSAAVRTCSSCAVRPSSNTSKMLSQMRHYLARGAEFYVHGSLLTVKTKLKSAFMDDGRPTSIQIYREAPFFGCILSGKINSVYEVERLDEYV